MQGSFFVTKKRFYIKSVLKSAKTAKYCKKLSEMGSFFIGKECLYNKKAVFAKKCRVTCFFIYNIFRFLNVHHENTKQERAEG